MAQTYNDFILSKKADLIRASLAEFLGTCILVLFACGACVATGFPWIKDAPTGRPDALVVTALTFGLTVMCLAATLGHVSGCHVNPAVTVGLFCNGKIDIIRGIAYIVSQLLGSIAGAGILYGVLYRKNKDIDVCATVLKNDTTVIQGIVIEAFIVFVLVFVVCNVCESNANLAPLTIGLAVSVGHLFAIPLTSASMNTARSFGPALIQNQWKDHYVYWVGPLVGGALAGLTHRFLFMNKAFVGKKSESKGEPKETTNV